MVDFCRPRHVFRLGDPISSMDSITPCLLQVEVWLINSCVGLICRGIFYINVTGYIGYIIPPVIMKPHIHNDSLVVSLCIQLNCHVYNSKENIVFTKILK